ncbi:MAG: zinc protease [Alphaproteobacteria bacterium]|jgi:zinc protease
MHRQHFIVAAILALIAPSAWGLDFSKFSLENGMDVYVIPDNRTPVVVNFVWYKTGAGDEKEGQTGIAHMLEHLMFKGTKNMPPQEFSKIVARHGGQDNAFTSYDYTGYFQKVAKENVAKMMEIEADRMRGLTFTDSEFLPERSVVMEERRWRIDSKPQNRFYEDLSNKHMPNHPYGRPIIGWKKDIEAYTSEMAHDWYKRWYQPNNAFLILVGDINEAEAKKFVAETYAKVPSTKQIEHDAWPIEPLWTKAKRFEKIDSEIEIPQWTRSYRVPSAFAGIAGSTKGTEDYLKLSLLSQVLGGGSSSILYESLVKDQKLADAVSVHYTGVARSESSFDVMISPKPGVKLAVIEAAYEKVLAQFLKDGVDEGALSRAKTKRVSIDIYGRDDPFSSAYVFGRWLIAGGTAQNYDTWLEDIKSINVSDLLTVAKTYMNKPQSTTGLLVSEASEL